MADFNPRVWFRDWLNKPTAAEQARIDASNKRLADALAALKAPLPAWSHSWSESAPMPQSLKAMFAAVESARRIQITPEIAAKAAELQQEADALGLTVEQFVARFPERAKIDRTIRPDAPPPIPGAGHPASPAPSEGPGASQ